MVRSDKPAAEAFTDWVCGEILPCIRKHGCYPAPVVQSYAPSALEQTVTQLINVATQLQSGMQQVATVLASLVSRVDRLEQAHVDRPVSYVKTGSPIGIREMARRLWHGARERDLAKVVSDVIRHANNHGIPLWKPVPNGPLVLEEANAGIISDSVCRIRELVEAPLFQRMHQPASN